MKNRVNRTVTPAMRTEFRERVGLPIGRVPSTRIFKQLLELAQREGIKVIRDNSGFPGMIMKDRESGKVGIFVRKDMPMAFQVFVLAHELGHWRLHYRNKEESLILFHTEPHTKKWLEKAVKREKDADRFAGKLIRLLSRKLQLDQPEASTEDFLLAGIRSEAHIEK